MTVSYTGQNTLSLYIGQNESQRPNFLHVPLFICRQLATCCALAQGKSLAEQPVHSEKVGSAIVLSPSLPLPWIGMHGHNRQFQLPSHPVKYPQSSCPLHGWQKNKQGLGSEQGQ